MKRLHLLCVALFYLGGCTSASQLNDLGGSLPSKAADGSSSPISQEQSWAIAKATIAKREDWPEHQLDSNGLIHSVAFGSRRINNGGWRVVAHRAVVEDRPEGAIGYDAIPAAIIVINQRGMVTGYARQYTSE